jgi:hypothetical protein
LSKSGSRIFNGVSTSGSGVAEAGRAILTINPAEPLAGRDIRFTLEGLEPWQGVNVGFLDPRGNPVPWITEHEINLVSQNGEPVTERMLFASGSGSVTWLRIATIDSEGVWGVSTSTDEDSTISSYSISQLQLEGPEPETVGVEMRKYQGSVSDTYFSTLVPATLAVDIQAHLKWVAGQIQELQGIQSTTVPDIYLVGNQTLFEEVASATGITVGFESGFYRPSGVRPGIYMRTDFLRTSILRLLTHEYVHLVLDEISSGRELPSWLNEGAARYFEYFLNLDAERPNAVLLYLYYDADLVKSAAQNGTLLDLRKLESQEVWQSQTDELRISLQYAQAYMAVRYLNETYGSRAAVGAMKNLGRGGNIFTAIEEETGVTYTAFQAGFRDWLIDWDDPERSEVRGYLTVLNGIIADRSDLSSRRSEGWDASKPLSAMVPDKQELVRDAQSLVDRVEVLTPPKELDELHQNVAAYLNRVADWLYLELEFVQTGSDVKRIEANDMIPEIDARGTLVGRSISDVEFVYNLAGTIE